jgi:IMP dehydrogenase
MLGSALAKASDAPGSGWHWGQEAHHEDLPRGRRMRVAPVAPLSEIVNGPAHVADGSANLIGALRRAMATTGYSELKEFQRVGVVHAER